MNDLFEGVFIPVMKIEIPRNEFYKTKESTREIKGIVKRLVRETSSSILTN